MSEKEKPLTAKERDMLHLEDRLKETEKKLNDIKNITGPKRLPD